MFGVFNVPSGPTHKYYRKKNAGSSGRSHNAKKFAMADYYIHCFIPRSDKGYVNYSVLEPGNKVIDPSFGRRSYSSEPRSYGKQTACVSQFAYITQFLSPSAAADIAPVGNINNPPDSFENIWSLLTSRVAYRERILLNKHHGIWDRLPIF